MDEEEKIEKELQILVQEHQELDVRIRLLNKESKDQLQIQRLKKRKLWLKDRITLLQSMLYPDIIA